jgi:hypothetical protein
MTVHDFIAYFDDVINTTEALFRKVPPEAVTWKPEDRSFTLGQQMRHMAEALGAFSRGLFGEPWGFASVREIVVANRTTASSPAEESILLLRSNYALLREKLGKLSEEDFNGLMLDTPQLGRVPFWNIALFGLEHHLTHKAELFMSLKMFGVQVHTGHLYRMR